MNSRGLITAREMPKAYQFSRPAESEKYTDFRTLIACDVRFGSKADICSAKRHVRFTPNSDRESGLRQTVMSALRLKADVCSALAHVR
jgi:hypothetical protein